MASVYVYVVDRDFGFAPNPFHGACTLATCKPRIRRSARSGDWVVGVGGRRLKATGRCIFAMRVDGKLSFDEYWSAAEFQVKKPVRNGSHAVLVGDNIYHRGDADWVQEDSHHSNADGTTNATNLRNDTAVNAVLISHHFYYFGTNAPEIPSPGLAGIGYRNGRNHRVFDASEALPLLAWLQSYRPNYLYGDPNDFQIAHARYSGRGSRIHLT